MAMTSPRCPGCGAEAVSVFDSYDPTAHDAEVCLYVDSSTGRRFNCLAMHRPAQRAERAALLKAISGQGQEASKPICGPEHRQVPGFVVKTDPAPGPNGWSFDVEIGSRAAPFHRYDCALGFYDEEKRSCRPDASPAPAPPCWPCYNGEPHEKGETCR